MTTRHDWTLEELQEIYAQPLFILLSHAHIAHAHYHKLGEVQTCSLISIKTGGCPEDCKYCTQSSSYKTGTAAQPMLSHEEVMDRAKKAIARGASRICLGAAWREARDSKQFEDVLHMIRSITALGTEVCCTLGMLTEPLAKRLKEAGLYAYNHNLDSSEKFYKTIITTRTYQDRLDTLDVVEKSGISVCCGGILGLGETITDRLELLLTVSKRTPHPDSFPINLLSPIPGTPLENQSPPSIWEFLRMIATSRIVLPKAMIRLSAGRERLSHEQQMLSFFAGANSIHIGEKLLVISNPSFDQDEEMFQILGLTKRPAFARQSHDCST
jgi:biotin synthase